MKRWYLASCLLALIISVSVCAQSSSSRKRTPSSSLPLSEQAKEMVRQYLESSSLTKCGDSYYSRSSVLDAGGITQFKNPSFIAINIYPLTSADRLNGITWKGRVQFRYLASRRYSNRWLNWEDYESLSMFTYPAEMRNSHWRTEAYLTNTMYRKMNCEDIPGAKVRNTGGAVKVISPNEWQVTVKKSDGWLNTGIPVRSDRLFNIFPLRGGERQNKYLVQLAEQSGASETTNSYMGRFQCLYFTGDKFDEYAPRLDRAGITWATVFPNWSASIKLKVENENTVDSIILRIRIDNADKVWELSKPRPTGVIRVDSSTEPSICGPNRPFEQCKPDPTVLAVTVRVGNTVFLNNEPIGTLNDLSPLTSKLADVFRKRRQQRLFEPGTNEVISTVWISTDKADTGRQSSLTELDVRRIIRALKAAGANPIKITDRTPILPVSPLKHDPTLVPTYPATIVYPAPKPNATIPPK